MTPTAVKTNLEEILDAIKKENLSFEVAQGKGEKEQEYFNRIITATSGLSEGGWNGLSKAAQDWYNSAAAAINELKDIPPCPGYQTIIPGTEQAKDAEKPVAAGETKKRGAMQRARELAILNQEWDAAKIGEAMAAENWKISPDSVWICTQEVKNVVKAIEATGQRVVSAQGA